MTLYELSLSYQKEAAVIKSRIAELNRQSRLPVGAQDKDLLIRISILAAEYTHLTQTATHLQSYRRK